MASPFITTNIHPQSLGSNQSLRVLANLQSMDLNKVADTVVPIINSNSCSPLYIVATNASTSLTTAVFRIYTGPGATGTLIASMAAGVLTASDVVYFNTTSVFPSPQLNVAKLYFRCFTAQGAPATADFWLYGWDFTVV